MIKNSYFNFDNLLKHDRNMMHLKFYFKEWNETLFLESHVYFALNYLFLIKINT